MKKYVITIEIESDYISSENMDDLVNRIEYDFDCRYGYINLDWHIRGDKKNEAPQNKTDG